MPLYSEKDERKWQEVFNKGLGVALTPNSTTVLEERGQQEAPSSSAQAHDVLEDREGPSGGVIVQALTPLSREVDDLNHVQKEYATNETFQCLPQASPHRRCQKPQIEEVQDEDQGDRNPQRERYQDTLESDFNAIEEEWMNKLELRQRERQAALEREEVQRETEWKEWLRKRRAEPGLRKWFFWRNRLRKPHPPPKLSVDTSGGSSASPSREVPVEHASGDERNIDPIITEPRSCPEMRPPTEVTPKKAGVTLEGVEETAVEEKAGTLPEGPR
ncbi:hypothetical protein LENED_001330 [Lentinula edodes]|uniref:Uncharacterized protein n=1 Tax=Lentinula edodes TaxID=5353 RepID=A0A1Q3DXU6_LENED|nr:hypothetical protein LENED_001330 [Lentinula edodes]